VVFIAAVPGNEGNPLREHLGRTLRHHFWAEVRRRHGGLDVGPGPWLQVALALSLNYHSAVSVHLKHNNRVGTELNSRYFLCGQRPTSKPCCPPSHWEFPNRVSSENHAQDSTLRRAQHDHESHILKNNSAEVTDVCKCTCLSVPASTSTPLHDRLYFGRKQPLLKSQVLS
jgi:hypothetical protein